MDEKGIPIEFIEQEIGWYESQMDEVEEDFRETLLIAGTALKLLVMKWRHRGEE